VYFSFHSLFSKVWNHGASDRHPRKLLGVVDIFLYCIIFDFILTLFSYEHRKSAARFAACAGFAGSAIICNWIYCIQERKPVEIRISGIDCAETILSHQNGRMGIEYEVACDSWNFGKHLGGNMPMSACLDENPKTRRSEEGIYECPCLIGCKRSG